MSIVDRAEIALLVVHAPESAFPHACNLVVDGRPRVLHMELPVNTTSPPEHTRTFLSRELQRAFYSIGVVKKSDTANVAEMVAERTL